MIKANISINLTKLGQNKAKISTSKKGEKWANLEIAVKDNVDQCWGNSAVGNVHNFIGGVNQINLLG